MASPQAKITPSEPLTFNSRAVNRRTAMKALLEDGPATRKQVADRTALSTPTVGALFSELESGGLIGPARIIEGRVGRAATEYAVHPSCVSVTAVDLAGSLLSALTDGSSDAIVEKMDRGSPTGLIQQISRLAAAAQPAHRVRVLSLAMPGACDPINGRIRLAPNLPDFGELDLRRELAQRADCTVVITNDVNAAAAGERHAGLAADETDFAFIAVGPGLGAGLVLDGQVRVGPSGAAGEIGWLQTPESGAAPKRDRTRGPLERVLSERHLQDLFKAAGGRGRLHATDILASANDGSGPAVQAVDQFSHFLATAVVGIAATLDLRLIVLGGEIGSHPFLRDAVVAIVDDLMTDPPRIATSALGSRAALVGAASVGHSVADELLLERAASL